VHAAAATSTAAGGIDHPCSFASAVYNIYAASTYRHVPWIFKLPN